MLFLAAGSHGNRWSMTTYRIALSIYSRSPAAYEALKSWPIFKLPSTRSLKEYSTTLLHDSGPYIDYMQDQHAKYQKFKDEWKSKGKPEPLGEGVLILDEVKVVGKVAWNTGTGKLMGICMKMDEIPCIKDLDQDLTNDRQAAEYFLQFLWRDLSSDFDIIGPHYSTSRSMDADFTHACFLTTLTCFESYDFKVSALVADGASTNLSMIKALTGYGHGAYGINRDENDPHKIKASFPNPHRPDHNIFAIICPTHQMKNLINQLHASRDTGAKAFETGEGVAFGWKVISEMWDREKDRRDNIEIRMVPDLVAAYIERDAWNKLNVKPAKIM